MDTLNPSNVDAYVIEKTTLNRDDIPEYWCLATQQWVPAVSLASRVPGPEAVGQLLSEYPGLSKGVRLNARKLNADGSLVPLSADRIAETNAEICLKEKLHAYTTELNLFGTSDREKRLITAAIQTYAQKQMVNPICEVAIQDVRAERRHQDQKWGHTFDDKNTPNDWVAYITQYAGQAAQLKFDPTGFRSQMIKVAALAVAAVEACDRAGGNMPKRHYD